MSEESTTPDLVELTRRACEAASSRDSDAITSLYARDAVWEAVIGLGTHEGEAAIRGVYEDWIGAYEELKFVPEQILDLGSGVVFAVVLQSGRLLGSGDRVQLRYGTVCVWVDGMIARQTNHTDIDEGRAAAERLAAERG